MNDIEEVSIGHCGYVVKVRKNKVLLPFFGTTYYNQSMHWEYNEVPYEKLTGELQAKVDKARELL